MTLAHARNLASLRTEVERLETGGGERLLERRTLGHAGVDAALKGGLALGACMRCLQARARRRRPPRVSRSG